MEEMTVNSSGGKQHKVTERYRALFPRANIAVARLRAIAHDEYGYEDDNYILLDQKENVSRADRHIDYWMVGDTSEGGDPINHLIHADCRLRMAIEQELIKREEAKHSRELEALRLEYGYEE